MPVIVNRRADRGPRSPLTIPEFLERSRRVLVQRNAGGLGDILVHRMLFQDLKRQIPDGEVHFACPRMFHPAVTDHPYIDRVLDCEKVDKDDYIVSYNTTTPCIRYEIGMAPQSGLNRSDIWAQHCGVTLTGHDMHIRMTDEELSWARAKVAEVRDRSGPVALVAPISTMVSKNLTAEQQLALAGELRRLGCCVIGLHSQPIEVLDQAGYPCLHGTGIRQWMSLIAVADHVVSVDSAAFHCAGGMGKRVMGIFTFCDGYVYGRYYDSVIVQRHRRDTPTWCGPCYDWTQCPLTKDHPKPCLTTITPDMLIRGVHEMLGAGAINT